MRSQPQIWQWQALKARFHDEVIDAMAEVGDLLPCSLKETSQAGLAQTETGKKYMPEL